MPQKAFICSSGCNDVRPGQVISFFRHRIKVKIAESYLLAVDVMMSGQDKLFHFFVTVLRLK